MANCTKFTESDVNGKMVLSMLFLFLISVFAIFGNTLVCAAFAKNRSLRILTNYYVVSLAVSDILVGAINVPLWMYIIGPTSSCDNGYLEEAYVIFDIICGTASIWNMTIISIDRFMAVTYPTIYRHRMKKKNVALWLLVFIWTFSVLVASLRIFHKLFNYAMFVTTLSFFIPFAIILFSYGSIFRVVRYRAKWTGSVLMEIKMARTLSIVIGAFIICWGPFFILNIVSYYCRERCKYQVAVQVIKWMQYASACVNPVVYTVRNRDFRFAFHKLIFQCSYRNGKYVIRPKARHRSFFGKISTNSGVEMRTRLATYTEDATVSALYDVQSSAHSEERQKTSVSGSLKRSEESDFGKSPILSK